MKWEKPSYIEINMNAEIGSYQEDEFREREPVSYVGLEKTKLRLNAPCSRGAHTDTCPVRSSARSGISDCNSFGLSLGKNTRDVGTSPWP